MYDQATKLRALAGSANSLQKPTNRGPKAGDFLVRTIAVTSGKGGVGKTNIAANMGIAIAAQNKRVGIIDADLGLANIDVILKLKPRYSIEHVIAGKRELKETFIRGPAGLTVIPASSGRLSLANLPDVDRDKLIRELIQSTSDFDIMFIDTAAGISNNVVDFALAAQEVIVITTPEPTAITDAYAVIKVISQLRRTNIGIIVNMVESPNQGRSVAERLIRAARQFISTEPRFMGHILADTAVSDAISVQQPLIFKYPESDAAKCINVLAEKILDSFWEGKNGQRT
jgi:flagellar biosynthesis protein FlhG